MYKLTPSKEPYCWVCADVELGVVMKWNEISFNDTQEVVMLEDVAAPDPAALAGAIRQMTDWIVEHHPETVFPNVKRALGQRLHERREELGLSLRDVAMKADMSVNNVHRVEQGKYNYTIDILDRVCSALNLGIDLFDGEED